MLYWKGFTWQRQPQRGQISSLAFACPGKSWKPLLHICIVLLKFLLGHFLRRKFTSYDLDRIFSDRAAFLLDLIWRLCRLCSQAGWCFCYRLRCHFRFLVVPWQLLGVSYPGQVSALLMSLLGYDERCNINFYAASSCLFV